MNVTFFREKKWKCYKNVTGFYAHKHWFFLYIYIFVTKNIKILGYVRERNMLRGGVSNIFSLIHTHIFFKKMLQKGYFWI